MAAIPLKVIINVLAMLIPEAITLTKKITGNGPKDKPNGLEELSKKITEIQEHEIEQSEITTKLIEETKNIAIGLQKISNKNRLLLIGFIISTLLSLICLAILIVK